MSSGSLGGWGNWSRAAPGSSADGYIFRDSASGHLRCSDAAWPFVNAVPTPSGRAKQPSTRQCDTREDDFLPGECGYLSVPGRSASTPQKCHWRQHPHRGPDTAYIAALHNTSAWKAVEGGRFAHGRHGHLSRCHCRSGVCSSKAIEKWTFRPHTGCSRIGPIEGVARLRSRPLTFLGDRLRGHQPPRGLANSPSSFDTPRQLWRRAAFSLGPPRPTSRCVLASPTPAVFPPQATARPPNTGRLSRRSTPSARASIGRSRWYGSACPRVRSSSSGCCSVRGYGATYPVTAATRSWSSLWVLGRTSTSSKCASRMATGTARPGPS